MHNTNLTEFAKDATRSSELCVAFHASSAACRFAWRKCLRAFWIFFGLSLVLANAAAAHAAPLHFEKSFTLFDTFGQTPHAVTNAFIRVETFGPLTRYWQPLAPNVMGEVIYKFELPGVAVSSNYDAHMGVYNGQSLPAFDPGSAGWLDVSVDGSRWTTLFDSTSSTSSTYYAIREDITPYVQGASVVFFRARLFMTTNPSGYGCSQFMRVNGDGGGYDPFTLRVDLAAVPEIDPAGMGSVLALVTGALGLLERRRLKVA
jgi:hypothetical protein